MVDTVFTEATSTTPGTVVHAPWLNDANTATYDRLSAVAGTNTITATGPLSMSAYASGQSFYFTPAVTNSGAATININGLGAKTVQKYNGTALIAQDLVAGCMASIVYDGTNFQLTNPQTFNLFASVPAANITGQVAIANGGTGQATANAAFTALSAGVTLSWRNKLINGLGLINQRGYVSGAATGVANQYTLDRWRIVVSGQSMAYAQSGLAIVMTAPVGGVEQVVESFSNEGGIYTLSWVGTATATVNGVAIVNGGQTSSITANTNITVRFSSGTVSFPQLERSTVATVFEVRPYQTELALCQRYCIRFNYASAGVAICSGVFFGATQAQFLQQLPVVMRIGPTTTASSLTFSSLTGIGAVNLGVGAPTAANESQINWTFLATAAATPGFGALMRTAASQWIQCDAEL